MFINMLVFPGFKWWAQNISTILYFFHLSFFPERDSNSDVLWTWSYPSISQADRELIQSKGCLDSDNSPIIPFVYWQTNRQWYYICTQEVSEPANLAKVRIWIECDVLSILESMFIFTNEVPPGIQQLELRINENKQKLPN